MIPNQVLKYAGSIRLFKLHTMDQQKTQSWRIILWWSYLPPRYWRHANDKTIRECLPNSLIDDRTTKMLQPVPFGNAHTLRHTLSVKKGGWFRKVWRPIQKVKVLYQKCDVGGSEKVENEQFLRDVINGCSFTRNIDWREHQSVHKIAASKHGKSFFLFACLLLPSLLGRQRSRHHHCSLYWFGVFRACHTLWCTDVCTHIALLLNQV